MSEPLIETERLVMRPPRAADLDGWAAFTADETAMRFLGGVQPRSVAWRDMAIATGSWSLQGFGFFSVLLRDSGHWIGRVGPLQPEGWPVTEVGWGILTAFQGQGYAREAATAAIAFAFDRLGWARVGHLIDPANKASVALACALGSRRIGSARLPAPFDERPRDVWGQDRADREAQIGTSMARPSPMTL